MVGDLVIFVSKRLQRPAAALLCLIAAQLALSIAHGAPQPAPAPSVTVAIGR
jgi:hypothetical protein